MTGKEPTATEPGLKRMHAILKWRGVAIPAAEDGLKRIEPAASQGDLPADSLYMQDMIALARLLRPANRASAGSHTAASNEA